MLPFFGTEFSPITLKQVRYRQPQLMRLVVWFHFIQIPQSWEQICPYHSFWQTLKQNSVTRNYMCFLFLPHGLRDISPECKLLPTALGHILHDPRYCHDPSNARSIPTRPAAGRSEQVHQHCTSSHAQTFANVIPWPPTLPLTGLVCT